MKMFQLVYLFCVSKKDEPTGLSEDAGTQAGVCKKGGRRASRKHGYKLQTTSECDVSAPEFSGLAIRADVRRYRGVRRPSLDDRERNAE